MRRIVLLLASVGLAVLLVGGMALVGVERAEATFPGENGNIAYMHQLLSSHDIHFISASGGTPNGLITNSTDDRDPTYSPDGTKIAYFTAGKIYTAPASGGTSTLATQDATRYGGDLTYSPDGSLFAYSGWNSSYTNWEIYTIPVAGGPPTQLTDSLSSRDPAYSPDGSKIAYQGFDGQDHEIYTIPAGGGPPTQLTYNETNDAWPTWQPLPGPTRPQTKADCKNGGWRDFDYRNQGQCIRDVNQARRAHRK